MTIELSFPNITSPPPGQPAACPIARDTELPGHGVQARATDSVVHTMLLGAARMIEPALTRGFAKLISATTTSRGNLR